MGRHCQFSRFLQLAGGTLLHLDGYHVNELRDDVVGSHSGTGRLERRDQSMAKHRQGHRLHVFGRDMKPPFENRAGLRSQNQILPGAGPAPQEMYSLMNFGAVGSAGRVARTRSRA